MRTVPARTDLSRALRRDRSDTILDVWVVPGARRSEIVGVHDGALRIRVATPPEDGKANRVMLEMVGDLVGVEVSLESGAKARRKRVRISGLAPANVTRIIIEALDRSD